MPPPSQPSTRRRLLALAPAAAALALAGCAAAPPPPERLLRLPEERPRPAPPAAPAAAPWVLAAAPTLPEALRHATLLRPEGDTLLRPLAGARWAEPLADAVQRLLLADLRALRGDAAIWSPPPPAALAGAPRLRVEIERLEWLAGGQAVRLEARWSLADAAGGAAPRVGRLRHDEPLAGGAEPVDAALRAHRAALWALAQAIAASR